MRRREIIKKETWCHSIWEGDVTEWIPKFGNRKVCIKCAVNDYGRGKEWLWSLNISVRVKRVGHKPTVQRIESSGGGVG